MARSQLEQLIEWARQKDNYDFALSNPNFEYWLLLHFEDGKTCLSASKCLNRLKKHLPNYDKEIDSKKITREHIKNAVRRAQQTKANGTDLLQVCGSTVYRLVERILQER